MYNDSGIATLSIWRDFMPARPLALSDEDGRQLLDSESGLQEEVYSWPLLEPALNGIVDEETRSDLHDRLFRRLDASKPPCERRLAVLEDFVKAAEAVIDGGGVACTPSESRSVEEPDGADEEGAKSNSTLCLHWRYT